MTDTEGAKPSLKTLATQRSRCPACGGSRRWLLVSQGGQAQARCTIPAECIGCGLYHPWFGPRETMRAPDAPAGMDQDIQKLQERFAVATRAVEKAIAETRRDLATVQTTSTRAQRAGQLAAYEQVMEWLERALHEDTR